MKAKVSCVGLFALGGLILLARTCRNSARNSARVRVFLRGPATRLSVVKSAAFCAANHALGALGIVNAEFDTV